MTSPDLATCFILQPAPVGRVVGLVDGKFGHGRRPKVIFEAGRCEREIAPANQIPYHTVQTFEGALTTEPHLKPPHLGGVAPVGEFELARDEFEGLERDAQMKGAGPFRERQDFALEKVGSCRNKQLWVWMVLHRQISLG